MPTTRQEFLSFAVTAIAFAFASTSLGLTASNNSGEYCLLFLRYEDEFNQLYPKSTAYCGLSLSSAIIAMVCLVIPACIELMKIVFGTDILKERKIGAVLQILLRIIAIIFLLINAIIISVGWANTTNALDSYYNITTHYNSGEIIGAAVCAGVGGLFTLMSLLVHIILTRTQRNGYISIESATEITVQ